MNHSANFFLYCITGRRFREALRAAFCSTDVETFDAARRRLFNNPRLVAAGVVDKLAPVLAAEGPAPTSSTAEHSSATAGGLARPRSVDLDAMSSTLDDERQRTRSIWRVCPASAQPLTTNEFDTHSCVQRRIQMLLVGDDGGLEVEPSAGSRGRAPDGEFGELNTFWYLTVNFYLSFYLCSITNHTAQQR